MSDTQRPSESSVRFGFLLAGIILAVGFAIGVVSQHVRWG